MRQRLPAHRSLAWPRPASAPARRARCGRLCRAAGIRAQSAEAPLRAGRRASEPGRPLHLMAIANVSNDVALHERAVGQDAFKGKRAEVERRITPFHDELGEAATDGRRLLNSVARKSSGEIGVIETRQPADDGVVIEYVEIVMAGPCAPRANAFEDRNA